MPTLIAGTSGSWTEATTWKVADATAELDGETYTNYTEVATSPLWGASSTFSFAGTVEVDAIAVKIRSRTSTASGTFSVCIGQAGTPVAGTTVTINATDIRYVASGVGHIGWVLFKFTSPVTLSASTNYTVMAQESVGSSDIWLLTNGTASNWLRQLRTTTTQTPAGGDKLIASGEWTAATTVTAITVIMNNNDTTDYGTGSTTITSLAICDYGTLSFKYDATTRLRLSGILCIYAGGTLNIGTVTNPIDSSYTATLEFDCAANGDFGLVKYTHGKLIIQGTSRTYDRCMLAEDAIQSATSIITSVSTGWKNGDIIVIAPTDRTATHSDYCILNGDASGTTVNLTSGLSWAHSSATLTQGEIIHLTRNVIITSVNSSYKGYTWSTTGNITTTTGETDVDWAQFSYLGSSVATSKNGGAFVNSSSIEISSIQHCSIVSCYGGIYTDGGFESTNTISYNVGYNNNYFIRSYSSATTSSPIITDNWGIGFTTPSDGINISTHSGTFTNNRVMGHTYGIYSTGAGEFGTFSNNVAHSNSSAGFRLNTPRGGTASNLTSWFNNYGMLIIAHSTRTIYDNAVLYGNILSNIYVPDAGGFYECRFVGGSLNGYSGYDTPLGLNLLNMSSVISVIFNGTSFGVISGSLIAHTGYDINCDSAYLMYGIKFYNCTWGNGTNFYSTSILPYLAEYFKDDGTEGNDFSRMLNGLLIHNTTAGENSGDCLEITPTGNTGYLDLSNYLYCNMFQCPAQDGVARTVYIKLKKTATLDSTNVSLALYQNGTLVDGWDNVVSSLSDSGYTEFSLNYMPTEDGILDMAIKLDGDAGSLYVDSYRWV